jgi:hypothetical protein
VSENGSGPRYEVVYEETFRDSLARIGIPWRLFESLVKHGVDTFLARNPYEERSTHEVTGTGGYRMLWTEREFGDIPPLAIAFRVDDLERKVFIVGADPVWGEEDLVPEA